MNKFAFVFCAACVAGAASARTAGSAQGDTVRDAVVRTQGLASRIQTGTSQRPYHDPRVFGANQGSGTPPAIAPAPSPSPVRAAPPTYGHGTGQQGFTNKTFANP